MVQELGMMPPDEEDNTKKQAFVTFGSFMVFGSVPLIVYAGLFSVDWHRWVIHV